jgi:hypothetical protein
VSQWEGGERIFGEEPGGNVEGDEKSATRSYAIKLRYVCEIWNMPGRDMAL